ncbi:MAG: hypothetical protein K2X99_12235 [Gemmatimonadaceae bacterium]|nr:hypothetical protein [Gemmatimonadaceae bacterium]
MRLARLLVVVAVVALPGGAQEPAPATLPTFAIADQFGARVSRSDVRGPVIILVADRAGFDGMLAWAPRLRSALPAGTRVIAVADMKGAPRLIRGMIRSRMPKDSTNRFLLDWDGALGRPIRGENRSLVAAIYAADGSRRAVRALPLNATAALVDELAALARP